MKKTLFIMAVIAAFCLLFAGCSDSSDDDDSPAQEMPSEKGDNEGNDSGTEKIPNYLIIDGDIVLGYNGETPEEIEIPEGTTVISDYAFQNCKTVKSVKIPYTVNTIGEQAFWGCPYLTNIYYDAIEAYWKKNVKQGDHAIPTATKINCIEIPECFSTGTLAHDNTTITGYNLALGGEDVVIPNGITEIGGNVFKRKDIKSIIMSDTVTKIGDNAFNGCASLESITLSKNLTDIGHWAFGDCTALKKITIPKSVVHINYSAFRNCPALKVYYESTVENFRKIKPSDSNGFDLGCGVVYCTDGIWEYNWEYNR